MIKVGITGGIGSGKTTICKVFEALNIPIYYADDSAKYLMNTNQVIRNQIIDAFGNEAYSNDQLNRTYLANLVFNSKEKTDKINQIVHPEVGKDFDEWAKKQRAPFILKEAALMFESESYKGLDKIITVSCPTDVRVKRVLKRDPQRTEQQVLQIIDKQVSEEYKIKNSDFVIDNSGILLVLPQVLSIFKALT